MRTKHIASLVAAVTLLLLCYTTAVHAFAAPLGWTVSQLTAGDNPNQDPWVSGDRVAWYGSDGANLQIYTWKVGDSAPTTLTSAPHDSEGPAVSGDRVVWETEVDPNTTQICTWKVGDSSPTTLTAGAHWHFGPQISGDRVVWQGYTDATHSQTYTWKVGDSSATTLATSASSNSNQAVSGDRVVWEGWDGAHDQIYTWKSGDSTPSMLTSVTGSGQAPEVSGDRVVWTGSNGLQSRIYTWAAGDTSATLVPSPVLNNGGPQVSGDRVVWQGNDGVAWHIYTWKSGDSSPTQMTYGTYNDDQNPQVSGDRIVWYGSGRVFTQRIGESEATTLSAPVGGLTWPDVSGDHVVWEGKDGSNWQVFDAESSNPTVNFPDANLDAAMRTAIGKPTGQIHQSDLAAITLIQFEGDGIKNLDGLQYLPNDMAVIDFQGNQITTITALAGQTNLPDLNLSDNQISDLTPLHNLTSLANVELNDNLIGDVTPLHGLTNLITLDLSDNHISDISPLHGVPLQEAWVQHNWLDMTPGSPASQTIGWWLGQGASVTYLPQDVGVIAGSVAAAGSGPLGGVSVSLSGGPSTTSAMNGLYAFQAVAPGVHTISFTKPYFASFTTTVSVSAGSSYTISAVLTPFQLPPKIVRGPNGASLAYKRKKGVAKFTLSATLSDARGALVGTTVWLQRSSNGKKWSNLYKLKTNASGKAAKAFSVKKKGTTYYRWSAAATAFDRAGVTAKQKVVVK